MANSGSAFEKYSLLAMNSMLQTAIWTFVELDVADLLVDAKSPQTAEQLAEKQGWNSEYLYRLLRLLADLDIVREIQSFESIQNEKTSRFELTNDGLNLTSTHPSKLRYILRWQLSPMVRQSSQYLPEAIRNNTNRCSSYVTGNLTPFEYFRKEENRDIARIFNEAMGAWSMHFQGHIVNGVDFGRFNKIVDIGGGLGVLLASILRKYPTVKQGICFDLPNVIEHINETNAFVKENISKDRYQFVSGDMFNPETIPQGDAYLMKSILHDWDDEKSIEILKSIRTATSGRQITLFIVEVVILSDNNETNPMYKQLTHIVDLQMLIMLNGKERTQKEYEYLLEQSGFQSKHLHRTDTPYSIIEAITV